MKIYHKVLILTILSAICVQFAYSQTLKLVRTDVDTSRSNFVTATYIFGVDVYADSLARCTGISFELHYTHSNYVKISQSLPGNFSKNGYFIVIPKIDSSANEGSLYVGVLSGDTVGSAGFNNPNIIHLEFAVTQDAPNNDILTFSFINAQAIVSTDTGGKVLNLNPNPFNYRINGYINIWPGDANNDGIVDTKDISKIGLFLGAGSVNKSKRTFKRPTPSTYWAAQRVLAWDSLGVAFADCDGNGEVSITDLLVVPLNFGKAHLVAGTKSSGEISLENAYQNPTYPEANAVRIPVYINSSESFIGLSGSINLNNFESYKVLGVELGEIFGSKGFVFSNIDSETNTLIFATGKTDNSISSAQKGILCYIVAIPQKLNNESLFELNLEDLYGMSPNGYIFPVQSLTSVNESDINNDIQINQRGNLLNVSIDNNKPVDFKIYDLSGNILRNNILSQSQTTIDLNDLNSGVYELIILTDKIFQSKLVNIIK